MHGDEMVVVLLDLIFILLSFGNHVPEITHVSPWIVRNVVVFAGFGIRRGELYSGVLHRFSQNLCVTRHAYTRNPIFHQIKGALHACQSCHAPEMQTC